jgi:hypothetical protein
MKDLFARIWVFFNKKKLIKELKPIFVFWYITFDGDQDKISDAMRTNYGVLNTTNVKKVLSSVNLSDYSFNLEKDFLKYCPKGNMYIVKKVNR